MKNRLDQFLALHSRSEAHTGRRLRLPWWVGCLVVMGLLFTSSESPWATEIYGVVRDNVTGLPMANATVILWDTSDTTTTNAQGEYYFPVMPAGGGTIVVGAAGYEPHSALATSCLCPLQGDIDGSMAFDAVDLNALIDALFFNGPLPQDAMCPTTRTDLDASAASDAVDLNYMIDLLFFNGPVPVDPCVP